MIYQLIDGIVIVILTIACASLFFENSNLKKRNKHLHYQLLKRGVDIENIKVINPQTIK